MNWSLSLALNNELNPFIFGWDYDLCNVLTYPFEKIAPSKETFGSLLAAAREQYAGSMNRVNYAKFVSFLVVICVRDSKCSTCKKSITAIS